MPTDPDIDGRPMTTALWDALAKVADAGRGGSVVVARPRSATSLKPATATALASRGLVERIADRAFLTEAGRHALELRRPVPEGTP